MAATENKFDIVVFGASGFTGQFVVEELARIAEESSGLSWAVAGRSMQKVQKVLESASKQTGKSYDSIPILIADITSYASLLEMAKQAKVVVNCVGPYRFYGEDVVKACIENGAHHIDISGEPEFLEKMQLLYHGKAREAGVYIVGSCGFDSIPSEMGVTFTKSKFKGDLNSVEAYLDLTSGPEGFTLNYGTFHSAVIGVAESGQLKPTRKALFSTQLPKPAHRLTKRSIMFQSEELPDKWCVPFPGSDRSVAVRTERYNYEVNKERPVQYMTHISRPSKFQAILMLLFGAVFGIFAKFSLTRKLLLAFPSFFTAGLFKKGGPTKTQIENTAFTMTFVGNGYSQKIADPDVQHEDKPDKQIITKVSGPEPGYVATPICLIQCAMSILKEQKKMPSGGGVLTPGAAFQNTTIIDRLQKRNIKFEVLKE